MSWIKVSEIYGTKLRDSSDLHLPMFFYLTVRSPVCVDDLVCISAVR